MNKYLIGFLVLVVGVAAGWYFLKGQGTPTGGSSFPEPSNATQETAATSASESAVATSSVAYTDSGFNPKTITVKQGTAVTFTNQSSGGMWVASDVHPTHQLLPGFDQLQLVVNGGSYQYTFVKVGTWTYHNHVKASEIGTVIVTQ